MPDLEHLLLQAGHEFARHDELPAELAGSKAGLKLCNVGGTLGVVDSTGTFTPLT